jgi:hypothetical protein
VTTQRVRLADANITASGDGLARAVAEDPFVAYAW